MKLTPQLYLRLAVAFCAVVGLYDVFVVASQFLGGNRFVKPQWVLYPDFLTPHSALRAWLEGKLSMVYTDIDKFTEYQNAVYADRFPYVVFFRPFLYPPLWLLLLLPLAWVAVDRAFAVFMAVTVGASAIEGRHRPWLWLAMATSPAAVHVVLSGQGTFLNVALMYGGLRVLERAPVAAGILFGLLAYKPQVCLLIPVALIAARQWRALFSSAATVLVLGLASAAVFGVQSWIDFIEQTRATSGPRMLQYVLEVLPHYMVTPYINLMSLGVPKGVASGVQFATAALAVVAVWWAFSRYPASVARTAVLIGGTFLVSPYMLNYDMLLMMPAALLLYEQGVKRGFLPLEPLVYAGVWLMPTLCMGLSRHHLPVASLAILAFGVAAVLQLRRETRIAG